ncbi:DUF3618 domain-containing protein [Brachybacterium sp. EF45031]|uniref:DUF3618 domain-containing protein n=1 Tax=Brachybacterium sillae TaxID=2810536 RepID=UPI00217D907C|nr:DUF3618 domain-containing protein [Brachybacterium sillae]MCS6711444.1 DUF3618 domain-containing protein [Brachybacterium sillae]
MTTSNNPDEIRAEIERTRYALGQDVDALAEKVSPAKAMGRQTNRIKDGIQNMKENIMGSADDNNGPSVGDRARYAAQDVQGTVGEYADQAREYAHQAGDKASEWAGEAQRAVQQAPAQVRRQTRGNPLAAGVIAFGAGMLLSALLPSSQVEQNAANRAKDSAAPLLDAAKEKATEAAQQLREELEPEARDAAASLKDSAAQSAQNLKSEGADKAQQVKDSAQSSAGEVKNTAKNA